MQPKLPKLPTGIQTFAKIREDGSVYVDKTEFLVNLIDSGDIYFLARPRRFGKSLTCSTFESLFQGKKEFFKGLYAEEFLNRPNFKPSPVIRLDMSGVATGEGLEAMKKSMLYMANSVARGLNIEQNENLLTVNILHYLIEETYLKYGERVVLLIDEYDSLYTSFFDKPEMANAARDI
jgi:hypothetical protein